MSAFLKRNWFPVLGGFYGMAMAAAGCNIVTLPYWIGAAAMCVAYIGAKS